MLAKNLSLILKPKYDLCLQIWRTEDECKLIISMIYTKSNQSINFLSYCILFFQQEFAQDSRYTF